MSSEDGHTDDGLAKAIVLRRTELGLKRRQLAERSHLSYPYISEIENGSKEPSAKALRQIAEALEMKVADLAALSERLEDHPADSASILLVPSQQSEYAVESEQPRLQRSRPRPSHAAGGRVESQDPMSEVHALRVPEVPSDGWRGDGGAVPDFTGVLVDQVAAVVGDLLRRWVRDELPELVRQEIARQVPRPIDDRDCRD